jgi:hypothetical protein
MVVVIQSSPTLGKAASRAPQPGENSIMDNVITLQEEITSANVSPRKQLLNPLFLPDLPHGPLKPILFTRSAGGIPSVINERRRRHNLSPTVVDATAIKVFLGLLFLGAI